ncbi:MAG: hypothetical protein AB7D57_10690 [Desulfovibrionaceae bacterium]
MGTKHAQHAGTAPATGPIPVPEEITEREEAVFLAVASTDLTEEQIRRVRAPGRVFQRQTSVLAIHWHPEFVPLEHIDARIQAMFPAAEDALIIPTQHNVLTEREGWAGVEVDCYSSGFNQKVQLLLHFRAERVAEATTLRAMLEHTFRYRSSQLFDFMETITKPRTARLAQAAEETGAGEDLVRFVRAVTRKVETLLDRHYATLPPAAIKNKLLRDFFDCLREDYGDGLINRAQIFLRAVKQIVKAGFPLKYFYRASEVIAEARALGGGVVIPHPEEFWPILLAGYDVDGYEVWNPQSQRYTDFLISVVNERNRRVDPLRPSARRLLVTMGDDCHLGEKVKDPALQDKAKAAREVGYQPAWDDLSIGKKLITAGMDRDTVIHEYRDRLSS